MVMGLSLWWMLKLCVCVTGMEDKGKCLSLCLLERYVVPLVEGRYDPECPTRQLTLVGADSACVRLTFTGVDHVPGSGVREIGKTWFLPRDQAHFHDKGLSCLFFFFNKPLSLMTEAQDFFRFLLCQLGWGAKHGAFSHLWTEDPESGPSGRRARGLGALQQKVRLTSLIGGCSGL